MPGPSAFQELAPFSCKFSPNIPELLLKLNCSLAVSTYQAGKLIFISPKDEEQLIQLPRNFSKPMGIAVDPVTDRLALATRNEVQVFINSPGLASHYPLKPATYDALYMPVTTYHTGPLDIHDLAWSGGSLVAVNTLFSCIMKVSDRFHFEPVWQPRFITEIVSEDRCHLNGLAMIDGMPKYATSFGTGNTIHSWRGHIPGGGVVMDLESGEVIAGDLAMPHSPRWIGDNLYVLLSATGEVVRINISDGKFDIVCKLDGFVRGMDSAGDFLFVGLSRMRKNSSAFGKLEIADKRKQAGIAIIHLPTGSFVGEMSYTASVDEIYDIRVLEGRRRPNILNLQKEESRMGLAIPGHTFWAQKTENNEQ